MKSNITVSDDNLLNSKDNTLERLWVLMRLNNVKTAVCVSYFPNDGVNKTQTDALMFELLKNTTDLQALGYEVAIMGDFNGRCLQKCEFSSINILHKLPSYNGKRLLQFTEASQLIIANTHKCCEGHYTRILNDQRSAIDYILLSNGLVDHVE